MDNSFKAKDGEWYKKIFEAAGDEEKEVLIRVVVNEGAESRVDDACLVEMIRWQNKIIEELRGQEDEKEDNN